MTKSDDKRFRQLSPFDAFELPSSFVIRASSFGIFPFVSTKRRYYLSR
jgi:hypothetical protein